MCLSFLLLVPRKLLQKLAHAKSKCSRNTVTVALMNPYCCIYWSKQEMSFQKDSKTKFSTLLSSVFTYAGYKCLQKTMKVDQNMSLHKKSQSPICWSEKEESNFKIRIFNGPGSNIKPLKKHVLDTVLKVKFQVVCADEMPQNLDITECGSRNTNHLPYLEEIVANKNANQLQE